MNQQEMNKKDEKAEQKTDEDLKRDFEKREDENVVLHTPGGEIPDPDRKPAVEEALDEKEKKSAA